MTPVSVGGWDNRSFHLGDSMLVRLPSAAGYVPQVEKEHRLLPMLAPHLPLQIPVPLALGRPGEGFAWPWSVYRWIEGETVRSAGLADMAGFARDVARFLAALQAIDASNGPPAGAHNFHRGGDLRVYDGQSRRAMATLGAEIDGITAREIWETALASRWENTPVFVHGDIADGNLLMRDGRLAAVIDFGCSGVGDPSADLVIAWNTLDSAGRRAFRQALPLDAPAWARGRGWALWKALISLAERHHDAADAQLQRRVIAAIIADHREETVR